MIAGLAAPSLLATAFDHFAQVVAKDSELPATQCIPYLALPWLRPTLGIYQVSQTYDRGAPDSHDNPRWKAAYL